jgi:ketosteroid isomerase-like protein
MTDRLQVEQLVRELHAARVDGSLDRLCALYAEGARLRIAGSTDGKPIAIEASGIAEIRPWLSILVKTFRLTQDHRGRRADRTGRPARRARRAHRHSHRILRPPVSQSGANGGAHSGLSFPSYWMVFSVRFADSPCVPLRV